MRISLVNSFAAVIILTAGSFATFAEPPSAELSKMLPNDVGGFHQLLSMRPLVTLAKEGLLSPSAFRVSEDRGNSPFIGAEVEYLSPNGQRLLVEIVRVKGDSDAYSFLTLMARKMRESDPNARLSVGEVGTASVKSNRSVAFFRGTTILRITPTDPDTKGSEDGLVLARLFADKLDKGGNDIPVLVKHLPDWLTAKQQAIYAVNLETLVNSLNGQSIIGAVSFEGGVEAVTANYGSAQLALIEFTTPQLAGDNDRQISAKIQELQSQGQPVPSAYRRVGNYSVFVFNAANEQAANELIDQVKYEQLVQWLGDNPHLLEKATREYYETTAGVLVAVVKASGLSLLACFAVGGFFGALLFSRRRAQQREAEAFSDAGGMLRLNIDEMTPETDSAKLLGRGN